MLLALLLALVILVCIALAGVVLLQRSEGGALGMGGGPSGFLTTRGAGDLLTRVTWILGSTLFALCLGLTILQGRLNKGSSVVDRLKIDPLSTTALTPRPAAPPAQGQPGAPAPAEDGFGAPPPSVTVAPAAGASKTQTPPGTNTGPTDPVAKTVGGLPNSTAPAPRTH